MDSMRKREIEREGMDSMRKREREGMDSMRERESI